MKYSKDAEANDMIHMGSDHRCVMETFLINTPKKDGLLKAQIKTSSKQQRRTSEKRTDKKTEEGESELEKKIPRDH